MSAPGGPFDFIAQRAQTRAGYDRRAQLAEMAAQRLESIGGDQAQYWARSLREDPSTALAMSQQYGGFGEIENSLRAAQAAGQAKGLDSMGLEAFRRGPQAFQQYASGLNLLDEVRQNQRLAGMGREELLNYYTRTDPTKAKTLAQMWGMGGLSDESIRKLQGDRQKESASFDQLYRAYKMANAADVDDPAWGQSLLILINKVLQPDSAVLEGEAATFAQSLQSLMEELGVTAEGVYNPRAPVGKEGRRRLLDQINQLTRVAMGEYMQRHEDWKSVNADLGLEGVNDRYARPGYERLDRIREEFGAIAPARRGGQQRAPTPAEVSKMTEVEIPGRGVFVRGPDGVWTEKQ